MLGYLLLGAGFAFAAAAQPGPLQAFFLHRALAHGWLRTLPAAFAPLVSDLPIVALALTILSRLPNGAQQALRLAGGALLLALAAQAFRAARRHRDPPQGPGDLPRTLLQAALINLLNPNPYLGWSLVLGPAVVGAWHRSPPGAVALVTAFYGTLVTSNAAFIILAGTARRLGPRALRILTLASAAVLATLGAWQIIQGAKFLRG